MPESTLHRCCFIVPRKLLLKLGDIESALESEHLRGHRVATHAMMLAGIPTGTKRRTVYDAKHGKTTVL